MRKRCQLTNVDVHVCRQFKYTELCAEHVLVQWTMSLVVDAMQCTRLILLVLTLASLVFPGGLVNYLLSSKINISNSS